ncbi:hypothetical protein RhiirC2_799441 [Rhizophagus irregularis]|uniref:Uncharacterized protein n=2 Tax=Rhizophagus irregularis TaxID=588596 RepID=A0A2N1M501_9GLOM|nr:hypothetical protein RhiirC2_799441 [Rhizophagus irregularis]
MTSETHILFDKVRVPFTDSETPLFNVLIEPILVNESNLNDESNLNELNESILNDEQISKFKKIYLKNKIEDIDEHEELAQKLKTELNKNDIEAQTKKLQTINCCSKMCLQNLIFQDNALITYQKFQNLNNNQKDMFLFGIITATARNETTTKGQKRFKLSSEYIFEGIKICNLAFLIIYGIGEKYWRNIRNHFMQHGISPRIHKAIGKVSNFALSFEKVLEVISFITNYGNIYGLPSPGNNYCNYYKF